MTCGANRWQRRHSPDEFRKSGRQMNHLRRGDVLNRDGQRPAKAAAFHADQPSICRNAQEGTDCFSAVSCTALAPDLALGTTIKEFDLYENGNLLGPAASAGVPAPKHGHARRALTGVVVAFAAMLGLLLVGIDTASAATHAAPAGGHVAVSSDSGGGSGSGGGGGSGDGTWDQTRIPL